MPTSLTINHKLGKARYSLEFLLDHGEPTFRAPVRDIQDGTAALFEWSQIQIANLPVGEQANLEALIEQINQAWHALNHLDPEAEWSSLQDGLHGTANLIRQAQEAATTAMGRVA